MMKRSSPELLFVSLFFASFSAGCSGREESRPQDGAQLPAALLQVARGPDSAHDSGAALTPAEADVPDDAPLVVFLGDSISAGLRVEPGEAFPAVVQRDLVADGRPFKLVNAGVSGDTSAGGLRRLDWLLKQEPRVLVLELGGNDGLRGQPVKEIEQRLHEIIERTRAQGVEVLLLGVRLPPSLGADYVRDFEAVYQHLADEFSCAYVPFFMEPAAGVRGMMQEDGIHPSSAGHAAIAKKVAAALQPMLAALAPSH